MQARYLALAVVLLGPTQVFADEAEDRAIAAVKKLEGEVTRDDKAPGRPVIRVRLGGTEVTDAGLKNLAPLKGLRTLNISYTKVTNKGVTQLRKALPRCVILPSSKGM